MAGRKDVGINIERILIHVYGWGIISRRFIHKMARKTRNGIPCLNAKNPNIIPGRILWIGGKSILFQKLLQLSDVDFPKMENRCGQ